MGPGFSLLEDGIKTWKGKNICGVELELECELMVSDIYIIYKIKLGLPWWRSG